MSTTLSTGTISLSALRGPAFNSNASVSLSQCIRRNYAQVEANSSDANIAGTSLPWRINYGTNNSIPNTYTGYTVGQVSISMSHLRGAITWFASATNDRYLWTRGIQSSFTDSNKNVQYYVKLMIMWANVTSYINTGLYFSSTHLLTSYSYGGYTYYRAGGFGFNWGTGYQESHVIART